MTVDNSANITASAGDGINAFFSGASSAGDIHVTNTGTITATAAGGVAINSFYDGGGASNISVTDGGTITGGQAGIVAQDGSVSGGTFLATGDGNINVALETNASITANGDSGKGGYDINAGTGGTGSISVSEASGDWITSKGTGIVAVNQAPTTVSFTAASSTVTVTSSGTINSGSELNNNSTSPSGIEAGYMGSNAVGDVYVYNYANITATAGNGIEAFYQGTGAGNITVVDEAGTTITALHSSSATSDKAPFGIRALNVGTGDITIDTSSQDDIDSGSVGIFARNEATSIASSVDSTITVTNYASITSGSITISGGLPGGIVAGYQGTAASVGGANAAVHGSVTVDNYGDITAASGYGIEAYNYGVGNVTVSNAGAIVSGPVGVYVVTAEPSDTTSITNSGTVIGNGTASAPVVDIVQSGGSATLTNSGTIEALSLSPSALAIYETGGGLTVSNTGTIIGHVTMDAAIDNQNTGLWEVSGTNSFTGSTNSITNAGTISIKGAATSFTSAGTLSIDNTVGGKIDISADASFAAGT